jgi:pyrophosphatase PpaX
MADPRHFLKPVRIFIYFGHMTRISCIIFDLDGTLTQTNELIFATFNHVTEKYIGRRFTPAEITGMFGPPEQVAIEKLVGKDRIDGALQDFYAYYESHHERMAGTYDGIIDMLEMLKKLGLILAVFTGKGKHSTLISLEMLGIKKYFDLIVTGNDVENHKPSADGIRRVMKQFGLQPEQVLMVGDAVADVKAAHEAGVKMAAVLWDSYGKEKVVAMNVDFMFQSVGEFSLWLKTFLTHSKN